jgi:hypothetical protein
LRTGLSRVGNLPRSGRSGKVAELYHQKRGLLQVGINRQNGGIRKSGKSESLRFTTEKPGLMDFSLGSLLSPARLLSHSPAEIFHVVKQ